MERRKAVVPADETDTGDLSDEAAKELVLAVTFINGLMTTSILVRFIGN